MEGLEEHLLGCRVEDGSVVPDGKVVLAPSEADLEIMIVGDELKDYSVS
jgi:hypothetical protein